MQTFSALCDKITRKTHRSLTKTVCKESLTVYMEQCFCARTERIADLIAEGGEL